MREFPAQTTDRRYSVPLPHLPTHDGLAARRFGEPDDFANSAYAEARSDDFSSASSDFKALGAFFCNLVSLAARQPESRAVSRAPVYHILWVRGFRAHTIPGRGFNLFKPLRRHFRATPSCRQAISRRNPGDGNASVQKIDDRLGDLHRDGGTRTNIERLRTSSKKFVERLGSYATLVESLACDRGAAGPAQAEAETAALMFERRLSSPPPRSRQGVRSRSGPRENQSPPPPPG
jgi:hypothetical protein